MKAKILILSTIVSSCILAIACNQSTADEKLGTKKLACGGQQPVGAQPAPSYQYQPQQGGAVTNPNMPTGNPNASPYTNPNGKRPCYPASKCNGDPNLIGRNNYSAPANQPAPANKPLSIDSTEKFTGTVQSVNRVNMPNQTQIQMVLTTDQGDLLVILGPASYIDQQKIKFQAGDKVTVTGYRVRANGQDVVNAAEVKKNGNTLQLLNEQRQPLWGNSTVPNGNPNWGGNGYGQGYSSYPSYSQGYAPSY